MCQVLQQSNHHQTITGDTYLRHPHRYHRHFPSTTTTTTVRVQRKHTKQVLIFPKHLKTVLNLHFRHRSLVP